MITYLVSRKGRPLHLITWSRKARFQPMCNSFDFTVAGRSRWVEPSDPDWDCLREPGICHWCLAEFRRLRDAVDLVADLPRGGQR